MALVAQGKMHLSTKYYQLDDINEAIADLHHGKIKGRGVLTP